MSEQHNNLSPADRELEAALKSLAPAAALGIDAIAAAFVAGQRAKRREIFAWRCATAATLFVVGALLATLTSTLHSPGGQFSEHGTGSLAAYREPVAAPYTAPQQSVLILNETVRQRGIEGLPAPRFPTAQLNPTDLF
jgi:hypothetical protein